MSTTRRLSKDVGLYAVGTVLQRSASLILVPLYTSILSVSEYGALETLSVIVQTLLILVNFGLSNALLRFYSECEDDADAMIMIRTSWLLVGSLSIGLFMLMLPSLNYVGFVLFKDRTFGEYIALGFLWAIGGALNQQFFAYFRARQEANKYVIFSLGFFLLLATLNILFVRFMNLKIFGVLLGNLIIVWTINVLATLKFWRHSKQISLQWAKRLFGFGFPLVFSMFGWLILDASDRYFLAYYRDLSEVGIYGLGYKVGLLVLIGVVNPFQLAWGPFTFNHYASIKERAKNIFSKVFTYLVLVFCLVGITILLFSSEIVLVLGSGKFPEATKVVPYILVAYLFRGIFYWAGSFFHLTKKTFLLSAIVVIMAGVNLILNWVWIPRYGWVGAAFSTILALGGCGLSTLIVGEVLFNVPLQIKRLSKISLGILIILSLHYLLLPIYQGFLGWFIRGGLLLFLPFWLALVGFFEPSELDAATKMRNSVFRRLNLGVG